MSELKDKNTEYRLKRCKNLQKSWISGQLYLGDLILGKLTQSYK